MSWLSDFATYIGSSLGDSDASWGNDISSAFDFSSTSANSELANSTDTNSLLSGMGTTVNTANQNTQKGNGWFNSDWLKPLLNMGVQMAALPYSAKLQNQDWEQQLAWNREKLAAEQAMQQAALSAQMAIAAGNKKVQREQIDAQMKQAMMQNLNNSSAQKIGALNTGMSNAMLPYLYAMRR